MANSNERIKQKIAETKRAHNKSIVALLKEANKTHLDSQGKVTGQPKIAQNSLRWTLAWKQGKISYDLNLIVSVDDNGTEARVDKVWVHRHASSDYDFEGHTPTTRMRRLTGIDLAEIKQALEAEFKQ